MQGNQIIELTGDEVLLSEALNIHFTNSNCDGTLVYVGFTADGQVFQFVCEKCHEIIQL